MQHVCLSEWHAQDLSLKLLKEKDNSFQGENLDMFNCVYIIFLDPCQQYTQLIYSDDFKQVTVT